MFLTSGFHRLRLVVGRRRQRCCPDETAPAAPPELNLASFDRRNRNVTALLARVRTWLAVQAREHAGPRAAASIGASPYEETTSQAEVADQHRRYGQIPDRRTIGRDRCQRMNLSVGPFQGGRAGPRRPLLVGSGLVVVDRHVTVPLDAPLMQASLTAHTRAHPSGTIGKGTNAESQADACRTRWATPLSRAHGEPLHGSESLPGCRRRGY